MGSPMAHGEKKDGVAEDDDDDTDSSIVMTSVVDSRSERSLDEYYGGELS